jgi:hypothetical protein
LRYYSALQSARIECLAVHAELVYNDSTMDEPTNLPEGSSPTPPSSHGGVDIHGDVRAGRDLVAGDSITVQRGFSAADVQRIALIVGALVFGTAACFFIFGAVSAAVLVGIVGRPLTQPPGPEHADSMQAKLAALRALPPGAPFTQTFSELEISSYFQFILGPQVGVSNGKARLMDQPGEIALSGNADQFGGIPFVARLKVTTSDPPFQVQGAWVKVLPTPPGSSLGYIPLGPLANNLGDRLNAQLGNRVHFDRIVQRGGGNTAQMPSVEPLLQVQGSAR